nr:hypothetical protein [Angustibacter aerolatus]
MLADLEQALQIAGKAEREARIDEIKASVQSQARRAGSPVARRRSRRPTAACRRSSSASGSSRTTSASTAAA